MVKAPHHTVTLYDTTLRDGAQGRGISYTLADKIAITQLLDNIGIPYIEGGWPGSNPKDAQYFAQMQQTPLRQAKLAAFGCTRRPNTPASEDKQLYKLIDAQTPVVTVVGKSWDLHVTDILRTTQDENLAMIRDSIRFLKQAGKEVIYDAEHFFDGFAANASYALATLRAASEGGADCLVLCDTNGGSLPDWISQVVGLLREQLPVPVGIHAHNDAELAVANALAAVGAGASHVQGTINGYGERCGNTNLIALIPTLQLKMQHPCIAPEALTQLKRLAQSVSDRVNIALNPCAAYVGSHAFAHKGGLHAAAVERLAASYEHINPRLVGNNRDVVVSELAGRGNVRAQAKKMQVELQDEQALVKHIKALENAGWSLQDADGSFELLCRQQAKGYRPPFILQDFSVTVQGVANHDAISRATVKVVVGDNSELAIAEAKGPVHALDVALRKALGAHYPALNDVRLLDYKVHILNPQAAVAATTRVWVAARYQDQRWATVACSENILQASCQALQDSMALFLLRQHSKMVQLGAPACEY